MKPSSNNRRPRSRNNNKRQGGGGRNNFDSNGPDGKVRGTAQQVFEKYQALARDAFSAGDRITSEAFFQFAEHYYRIYHADNANNQAKRERSDQQHQGQNNSTPQQMPQNISPETKTGENSAADAEPDVTFAPTNVTVVPINEQVTGQAAVAQEQKPAASPAEFSAESSTASSTKSDESVAQPRKKKRVRRPRTTTKIVKNDESSLPASMLPDPKAEKETDGSDAETPPPPKDVINA